MNIVCPSCADRIVPPSGNSDLLIVGDAPGKEDYMHNSLFSTNTNYVTPGKVLRRELERVGASIRDFRVATLWMHEPSKEENCYKAGFDHILDEAKGKKAILLMGSDTVEAFTVYKVSDVSGLQIDSPFLGAPIIYALVSPGLALSRGMGEVRFGIEKFVKRLQEEGLLC